MTAGSPSPLSGTRSGKTRGRDGVTTKKLKTALGRGKALPTVPPPHLLGRDPLWGCIWGGGGTVEGENKGALSAAITLVPPLSRFPNTWAWECMSGLARHPRPLPTSFSNPNQVSPLYVPPELQPPRLGLGSGLPRKIRSQLAGGSQLYPGAHTPCTHQGGGIEGKARGENTTPSFGREECGKWVGLLSFGVAANGQPAADPKGADQPRTCQKDSLVPGKIYKVKLASSALAGGAEK